MAIRTMPVKAKIIAKISTFEITSLRNMQARTELKNGVPFDIMKVILTGINFIVKMYIKKQVAPLRHLINRVRRRPDLIWSITLPF